jgi:hypothetical protein
MLDYIWFLVIFVLDAFITYLIKVSIENSFSDDEKFFFEVSLTFVFFCHLIQFEFFGRTGLGQCIFQIVSTFRNLIVFFYKTLLLCFQSLMFTFICFIASETAVNFYLLSLFRRRRLTIAQFVILSFCCSYTTGALFHRFLFPIADQYRVNSFVEWLFRNSSSVVARAFL